MNREMLEALVCPSTYNESKRVNYLAKKRRKEGGGVLREI